LLECNHVGCPDSARMIGELRAQIATGESDTAVLDWFVAKYGATILAAPIRGGFDNAAWIVPVAIFFLATVGTFGIVWLWKRRTLQLAGAQSLRAGRQDARRLSARAQGGDLREPARPQLRVPRRQVSRGRLQPAA